MRYQRPGQPGRSRWSDARPQPRSAALRSMPVGETPREQELVRARRLGPDSFQQESLAAVKFVPLVGAAGWPSPGSV